MKKRKKISQKIIKPSRVIWEEEDGEFRLYKYYGKKRIEEPFYITDSLEDLIDELTEKVKRWQCKFDYVGFLKFIEKHKKDR